MIIIWSYHAEQTCNRTRVCHSPLFPLLVWKNHTSLYSFFSIRVSNILPAGYVTFSNYLSESKSDRVPEGEEFGEEYSFLRRSEERISFFLT
jgi:hypothetical protein